MGNVKAFALVFGIVLAMGLSFAASSEPILQISDYTIVPGEVYAGAMGYIQVTLDNTGTATAESISARYSIDGVGGTVYSGDISSGSSGQISIPFRISQAAAGSIQVIAADIYYSYDSGSGGAISKQVLVSVPVEVKQQNPLEVRTTSIDRRAVAPGERFTVELELKNTGGVINNLVITMPQNSSFSLEGSTQKTVGSISANSSATVSLALVSSSSTAAGTYSVPVIFTYQDALKRPSEQSLSVGPISVQQASSQYRLSLEPLMPVEVGSQADFLLTLENTGSQEVSATVDINATEVFTPVGMQRLYFDSVPAGGSASRNVTIGISSSKGAGYYTLPLKLTTSAGQSAAFDAGIAVDATPQLTLSLEGSSTIQIANTGNTQVRSVYAKARQKGASAYTESFIGTLNMDDSATLELSSSSKAAGLGASSLEVVISFRDSNNYQHVINETLDSSGLSSSQSSGTTTSGTTRSGTYVTSGSANPLGMLFGPAGRTASGTSSGGFGILPAAAALILVAAGGYLAYRRFWKGKKSPPQIPLPQFLKREGKQK